MSSVPVVSSLADPRIFAAAAFYAGLAALCARLLFGGSWADGKLKSEVSVTLNPGEPLSTTLNGAFGFGEVKSAPLHYITLHALFYPILFPAWEFSAWLPLIAFHFARRPPL